MKKWVTAPGVPNGAVQAGRSCGCQGRASTEHLLLFSDLPWIQGSELGDPMTRIDLFSISHIHLGLGGNVAAASRCLLRIK